MDRFDLLLWILPIILIIALVGTPSYIFYDMYKTEKIGTTFCLDKGYDDFRIRDNGYYCESYDDDIIVRAKISRCKFSFCFVKEEKNVN